MSLGLALKLANAPLLKGVGDPTLLWDLDFANQVYRYNRARYPAVTDLPGASFTRATTKYAANSAGVLVPFASGTLAATDAGASIEAAATNLLLQSGAFDNGAAWSAINAGTGSAPAITANAGAAPDGTNSADRIVFARGGGATSGDYSLVSQGASVTATAVAGSIFLKSNTGVSQTVLIYIAGDAYFGQTLATVTPTWQRFAVAPAMAGTVTMTLAFGTLASVGGDADLDVLAWGGQLEAGSFATSYIPTTTAPVTRNADALVSADSVISPTIVAEFTVPPTGALFGRVWEANDGTSSNRIRLLYDRAGNVLYATADVGGAGVMSLNLGAGTPGQTFKVAMRIAASNFSASMNGGTCVTAAAGALPPVTTFFIGGAGYGGEWGSGIRRIKRHSVAKSDSQLRDLSA